MEKKNSKNGKKQKNITTAASLQTKSENMISIFKAIIAGLKATNEEAEVVKAANENQIAALQAENATIAILSEKNARIVQNIENILDA